ncbi:MAG: ABC transporter permease, partial [Pseudomonadota bacterium]
MTTADPLTDKAEDRAAARRAKRMKRFDNPWMNPKLLWGAGLLLGIVALGLLGRLVWDLELVFTGSTPLKLPPVGFENLRRQEGVWDYPLGTDGSGRDMLALIIMGAPNSL